MIIPIAQTPPVVEPMPTRCQCANRLTWDHLPCVHCVRIIARRWRDRVMAAQEAECKVPA